MVDVTTYSEARQTLAKLMDRVVKDNEPVIVARKKRGSVVLVSLAEWNSLQETLHLVSTRANTRALLEAIDELNAGRGVAMTSDQFDAVIAGAQPSKLTGLGPGKTARKRHGAGKTRKRAKKIHREAAE